MPFLNQSSGLMTEFFIIYLSFPQRWLKWTWPFLGYFIAGIYSAGHDDAGCTPRI